MIERPILFSGAMVKAIVAGRKFQTRRVCRHQHDNVWVEDRNGSPWMYGYDDAGNDGPVSSPYGESGTTLWVRETWYCDDYRVQKGPYTEVDGAKELLYYLARDQVREGGRECWTGFSGETMTPPWKPSIHMPRWAARIFLRVTGVRVERLQDIGEHDAVLEGVGTEVFGQEGEPQSKSARPAFARLWDSLNEKRGFGWSVNPLVWVIEFERQS